jgi:hypothetical protein
MSGEVHKKSPVFHLYRAARWGSEVHVRKYPLSGALIPRTSVLYALLESGVVPQDNA